MSEDASNKVDERLNAYTKAIEEEFRANWKLMKRIWPDICAEVERNDARRVAAQAKKRKGKK